MTENEKILHLDGSYFNYIFIYICSHTYKREEASFNNMIFAIFRKIQCSLFSNLPECSKCHCCWVLHVHDPFRIIQETVRWRERAVDIISDWFSFTTLVRNSFRYRHLCKTCVICFSFNQIWICRQIWLKIPPMPDFMQICRRIVSCLRTDGRKKVNIICVSQGREYAYKVASHFSDRDSNGIHP